MPRRTTARRRRRCRTRCSPRRSTAGEPVSGAFAPGERALLMDSRGRRFMIRLRPGETFHFHAGSVPHDEILGQPEGVEVRATGGGRLVCLRPTLADFVLKMPRGAQVVYPK